MRPAAGRRARPQELALALWVVAEDGAVERRELAACRTSAQLDPRSVRNAANLDLCLPAAASAADAPSLDGVFPVTLLRQGEGAEHTHRHHHLAAATTNPAVDPPGIWPARSRSVRAGAGPDGPTNSAAEADGYSATCRDCLQAQEQDIAAADAAFGEELRCDQRFSASRFAAPRLRALVSVASLALHATSDRTPSERVRYSLVLVTEDGSQPLLRDVLVQAHAFLHRQLADPEAATCATDRGARGDAEGLSPGLVKELLEQSGDRGEGVHMLRQLLNARPLALFLESLMHALSDPAQTLPGREVGGMRLPRAAATLSSVEAGGAFGSNSNQGLCSEDAAIMAEVKGGEVWVWGGAVRFSSQIAHYDGTLGLASLGSVEQVLAVLGGGIMDLWRSLMLRRRILILANTPGRASRAVCAALALISSPSVDLARAEAENSPMIDCFFPLVLADRCSGGQHRTAAACCAALNALNFYVAGVTVDCDLPARTSAVCELAPGRSCQERPTGAGWGGFVTAEVLVDLRDGTVTLLAGNDDARGEAACGEAAVAECTNATSHESGWRRVAVTEHAFLRRIAPAASPASSASKTGSAMTPSSPTFPKRTRLQGASSSGVAGEGWPHASQGTRNQWLMRQFSALTDELLRAVRQDRINGGGFSRELGQLKLNPPPLTCAMALVTRVAPHRLSPVPMLTRQLQPPHAVESPEADEVLRRFLDQGRFGQSELRQSTAQARASISRLSLLPLASPPLVSPSPGLQHDIDGEQPAARQRGVSSGNDDGAMARCWHRPQVRSVLRWWEQATHILQQLSTVHDAAHQQEVHEAELVKEDAAEDVEEDAEGRAEDMRALQEALTIMPHLVSRLSDIYSSEPPSLLHAHASTLGAPADKENQAPDAVGIQPASSSSSTLNTSVCGQGSQRLDVAGRVSGLSGVLDR